MQIIPSIWPIRPQTILVTIISEAKDHQCGVNIRNSISLLVLEVLRARKCLMLYETRHHSILQDTIIYHNILQYIVIH